MKPENFENLCISVQKIIRENSYTIDVSENRKPYVNKEILNLINIKDNFAKLTWKYPHANYYKNCYKKYRNLITNLIRKEKKRYLNDFFDRNLNNPKETWNQLKSLLYNKNVREREPSCKMLMEGNFHISDPKLIANTFNRYFVNVASTVENYNVSGINETERENIL